MSAITQTATGSSFIDGLLSGTKWAGTITFSFPQLAGQYPVGYGSEPLNDFSALSGQGMEATRAILGGFTTNGMANVTIYGSLAGLVLANIQQAAGNNGLNADGIIRSATSGDPSTAHAYYPNNATSGTGGDVWYGIAYAGTVNDFRNPVLGNYAYHTTIHELGHALGLKHAHETGGVSNIALPSNLDALDFTVMTYRSYVGGPTNGYSYGPWDAPQTFMMYDILALQTMYGADYATNNGNTTYSWNPNTGQMLVNGVGQGTPGGNHIFLTIWDGGGIDTYDISNYTNNVTIDLAPGGWSITSDTQRANLGNGHRANGTVYNSLLFGGNTASLIENAYGGSGNDIIYGNTVRNELRGNGGSDILFGLSGSDTLLGGTGNDIMEGGQENDYLNGESGNDIGVFSGNISDYSINFNLQAGIYTVSDAILGRDGIDTLRSIEKFRFANQESWAESAANLSGVVHRFYNTEKGVHFYTSSNEEANSIRTSLPSFDHEGLSFRVAQAGAAGVSDVYRFYNTRDACHFYTQSAVERDDIIANLPIFQFEGTGFQAYSRDLGPQKELYRFFNSQTGAHFFTTSDVERNNIIDTLPVFKYEGIAFYVDLT